MHYDKQIVSAYLQDMPISKTTLYPHILNYHTPDTKRKDIVQELSQQLEMMTNDFPVFNPMLWDAVFANKAEHLDSIHVCAVVGSDALCHRILLHEETYIFIDLICVANCTRIVSQMTYILKNTLMLEISKTCILIDFPLLSKEYDTLLDAATFIHGFAHWISWNYDCDQYIFQTDKYEQHREKAFGLLSQAHTITNKAMQHKILVHIHASSLWEQFPVVAGMFYFDDIYHELGNKGIQQLYQLGPKHFIERIFTS